MKLVRVMKNDLLAQLKIVSHSQKVDTLKNKDKRKNIKITSTQFFQDPRTLHRLGHRLTIGYCDGEVG